MWTNRGLWKNYLKILTENKAICCHVETCSDKVTIESVPSNLANGFINKKVFVWEPNVFKVIKNILELGFEMRSLFGFGKAIALSGIHYITKEMWRVHDHGYLRNVGAQVTVHGDTARNTHHAPVLSVSLPNFLKFLKEYNDKPCSYERGFIM
jgi:hypothetical protein